MFHRYIKPPKSQSFFLLGPRGTGKSTWCQSNLGENVFRIDLLRDEQEQRYLRNPDLLSSDLAQLKRTPDWIVIDEIQKVPKLLDTVHLEIESHKRKFVLTGSSARKLKRNEANLLAGRAFVKYMFPLTMAELGEKFSLGDYLNWGSLPKVTSIQDHDEKESFLRSYAQTYLKEEILLEQLVRNGQSFRDFLLIAGLENGNVLNFSKIGRDLGADTKTVQNFFSILEDTMAGFYLPAYHRSIRKSQKHQPKFYLFDPGVKRAMDGTLKSELVPRTSAYGKAFEHFVILEVFRLNQYFELDFRLSHYQETKGAEIDLLLTRGRETWTVEIKSSDRLDPLEVGKFASVCERFPGAKKFFVSQDKQSSLISGVQCLHYSEFLKIFLPGK